MPQPHQRACRNHLLRALVPVDFARLRPHLSLEPLALGEVLIAPDAPIARVHFVEQGIVSLVARARDGAENESGLVGREGLVGVPVLHGVDRTPGEARVQAPGLAFALPAQALRTACEASPALRGLLLRFAEVLATQVAHTALASARYGLTQRLARWLLMCHDRADGDVLPVRRQELARMLGVNRPGLSACVAAFARDGLLANRRGTLTIRNRAGLLAVAGAAYGTPEAQYARLLPSVSPSDLPPDAAR